MAEQIISVCVKEGRPLPAKFENAPELDESLVLYWEAFNHLSSCRGASFGGLMPIPWLAIDAYAKARGLDEEQAELLEIFIRRLDEEFLKFCGRGNGNANGDSPAQRPRAFG